jgi:sulfur relay (sulfurtransferase) DsrF/TusC family protein
MAKQVAVIIKEDPRKTHRPVEALRIALGLVGGEHQTTVVLLGEAVRLISDDTDDVVDVDILEKYLPSIEQLEIPFVVEAAADRSLVRPEFKTHFETADRIRNLIQSMDRTLVF